MPNTQRKIVNSGSETLEGPPLDAYPFGGIVKYEGKKSQPLKGGDDADENDNFFGGVNSQRRLLISHQIAVKIKI